MRFEFDLHYRCVIDKKDLAESEAYALLVAEHGKDYAEKWVEEYEPDTGHHQLGIGSPGRSDTERDTASLVAKIRDEGDTKSLTLRTG